MNINLSYQGTDTLDEKGDCMKPIRALLKTNEAAEYLRLKAQTLANWRHNRKGPDYIKMGRYILYEKKTLDQFVKENCIILNNQQS